MEDAPAFIPIIFHCRITVSSLSIFRLMIPESEFFVIFYDESKVSFTDNEENIYEITDHGSIQITFHEG